MRQPRASSALVDKSMLSPLGSYLAHLFLGLRGIGRRYVLCGRPRRRSAVVFEREAEKLSHAMARGGNGGGIACGIQ